MLVPFLSIITKLKKGLISQISSALDYFCGPQRDSCTILCIQATGAEDQFSWLLCFSLYLPYYKKKNIYSQGCGTKTQKIQKKKQQMVRML